MSQLFSPRANTVGRMALLALLLLVALLAWTAITLDRSPYLREVGTPVEQPVRFSHLLHSGQLQLDCQYCHSEVERAAYAGMPTTHTCMTCHSQVAAQSFLLETVRESYAQDTPLVWNRIHDLSEGVYFDHSIHVQREVGCEECHGRVEEMPLVWQSASLTMEWCLDCHREQPAAQIDLLTDCSTCHR